MKSNFKKLFVVLCILSAMLCLTACGKEKEVINYNEAQVNDLAQQIVSIIGSVSSEDIKSLESTLSDEEYEFLVSAKESYDSAMKDLESIESIDSISTFSDEKTITALVNVTGTTGKTAQVEIILDKRYNPTSCATNVDRTFGENMTNAGLNTLLGMGTVFVVLILISFIISMFKYIAVIEEKMKKKKEQPSVATVAAENTVAQIVAKEELSDDTELVAVISAAIAAYEDAMGGSSDGYVVRSIKRRY